MVGTAWHKRMNAHEACKENNPLHRAAGGPGHLVAGDGRACLRLLTLELSRRSRPLWQNHTVTVMIPGDLPEI